MADKINLPKEETGATELKPKIDAKLGKAVLNAKVREKELDNAGKKEERGWLGKFFGGKDSSSNNIAGAFIFILLFIGAVYTAAMLCYCPTNTHMQVLDIWGILTPMITLAIGYIFGNRQN